MINYIKSFYLFFVIVFNLFVFFPLLLIQPLFAFTFKKSLANLSHTVATCYARAIFAMIPGWSLSVSGQENLPKKGESCVFVANHSSATDILSVYFIGFVQFRWLSKKEMFKFPLIGLAMRWCQYVSVDRGNKNSHTDALRKCAKHIKEKTPVLFFPEGTRSKDGKLKQFKPGAFKLAAEYKVPVVPVVIKGSNELLEKGSLAFKKAHLRLMIMPSVYNQEQENISDFARRVRNIMAQELNI
jgi:1-acyl-sn-glycerol-3-phosphate acyltransferase